MNDPNIRRKIVLSEEDMAPIVEFLQADEAFKDFKRGAQINEFLLTLQRSVKEYSLRQRQEQAAFGVPDMPQVPVAEQEYRPVDPTMEQYYNQNLAEKAARKDHSYYQWLKQQQQQQAQAAGIGPQQMPPLPPQPPQIHYPSDQEVYGPSVSPEPIRASQPVQQAKVNPKDEEDDVDFEDFDDDDF